MNEVIVAGDVISGSKNKKAARVMSRAVAKTCIVLSAKNVFILDAAK